MNQKTYITDYCHISQSRIKHAGIEVFSAPDTSFSAFSKEALKHFEVNYPKFFKMDNLSKLAFLSAEMLLGKLPSAEKKNVALVLANKSASLDTDVKHQQSITDLANYYPSPAVFVYTLPNICLGEISIRHQLQTENVFFVFDQFPADFFSQYAQILFKENKTDKVFCGWVEFFQDNYEAFAYLVSQKSGLYEHNSLMVKQLFTK